MIDMGKPLLSPTVPCSDKVRVFGAVLMGLVVAVKLKSARVLKMTTMLTGNS
jgi:hypothetical protein